LFENVKSSIISDIRISIENMGFFIQADESNLLFAMSNTACYLSHCGLCVFLEAFDFDLSQSTISSTDDSAKKTPNPSDVRCHSEILNQQVQRRRVKSQLTLKRLVRSCESRPLPFSAETKVWNNLLVKDWVHCVQSQGTSSRPDPGPACIFR
jgi:hypothetical protein